MPCPESQPLTLHRELLIPLFQSWCKNETKCLVTVDAHLIRANILLYFSLCTRYWVLWIHPFMLLILTITLIKALIYCSLPGHTKRLSTSPRVTCLVNVSTGTHDPGFWPVTSSHVFAH